MSSTQFTPAATIYPLSFHKPAASCISFSHSRPLFSITSSLFWQNRGGGYTPPKAALWNQQLTASFFRTCLQTSYPSATSARALCFHILTNPFSRNSLVFTSIQNLGGCGVRSPASKPHRASPFCAITYMQPLQFHAITHSFAQRRQAIPPPFNRFRTLSIATGVVPPPERSTPAKFQSSVPVRDVHSFRHSEIPTFSDPKEVTTANTAACYSKHLRHSTSFRLSSTSRLPARVPHPRCDPQHLRTCGRRVDEITGCFLNPAA